MFYWGHRGCRRIDTLDENTLAAFDWALENGAHGLEFDVQLSDDGVAFVFHDATPSRVATEGDDRLVESLDWFDIQRLSLRQGGRVPRLEEMKQYASHVRMNLEIKTRTAVSSVIEFLGGVKAEDWVVSSFEFEALLAVRASRPAIEIGYLLEKVPFESEAECLARAEREIKELGPQRVHLDDALCNVANLSRLGALGLPIHVWTVNTVARGAWLESNGAEGLFTDDMRLFSASGLQP